MKNGDVLCCELYNYLKETLSQNNIGKGYRQITNSEIECMHSKYGKLLELLVDAFSTFYDKRGRFNL